jgi:hypothetical protein
MAENLWGTLPTGENVRTPHSILLEQANLLTQQTEGILVGRVRRELSEELFESILQIVVPA